MASNAWRVQASSRYFSQAENKILIGDVSVFVSKIKSFFFSDPPGPPVVEVIPRGPFALTVRWNSSTQDLYNIKILDYILKVFDGPFAKQIYTAIANTSLIVKNLSRNRTYVIEIQARNEVGYGEVANISATTSLVGKANI